ncbi:MAG: MBL fold metallo-hydrolase, partial [Chloroflexota bacterium]|nr:MBL fold metallo-hydrolase [Chloroflexota bacterium]
LTHPHADHLTGLLEVVRRYRVRQVLLPQADYDSPLYREWLSLIREKNIGATLAEAGQQINLGGGALIEVLNAPASSRNSDTDNDGVVLRLVAGTVSVLLTADIEQATEGELLSQRAISASTILKVAHHGSNTSTSSEFLAVTDPQAAVISSGTGNRFGHPSPEVVKRLEQQSGVYRTDQQGTIEFTTDGERLWVKTER